MISVPAVIRSALASLLLAGTPLRASLHPRNIRVAVCTTYIDEVPVDA